MRAREFIIEAAYDSMVVAMKQKFPDQAAYIDQWVRWTKTALQKADRVTWFLKILRADLAQTLGPKELGTYQFTNMQQLSTDIQHFYGINYAPIQGYRYTTQTVGQVIDDLNAFEEKWWKEQAAERGVTPQEGDYKLFEFADGTAWWFVNRAYCPEEGRSGRHCGNVVGKTKTDQRILSLRNSKDQVICTFILEPDNMLGEMKAKWNHKPSERYHPQILTLLMWNRIKGIAPSSTHYLPEANFNVFDLTEQQVNYIDQNKPELIVSQIKSMPMSAIHMPESLKEKYQNLVIDVYPALGHIFFNPTEENWVRAIAHDPWLIIDAPNTLDNWREKVIGVSTSRKFERRSLLTAPARISKDINLLKEIVDKAPWRIGDVNPNLKGYEDLCESVLEKDGSYLHKVPETARSARLCQAAVAQYGHSLRFVPNDHITPDLCKLAIANNPDAISHVPKQYQNSDLFYEAISRNGHNLKNVPMKFRTPELCSLAVNTHGRGLAHVPTKLRTPELCRDAVKNIGWALEFVPENLRTPELCILAVNSRSHGSGDGGSLRYVPENLRTPKLCTIAIKNSNGSALGAVPEHLITPELQKLAIKYDGRNLKEIPKTLQTLEICNLAVKADPSALEYVSPDLRTLELCVQAVKKEPYLLQYVPAKIKAKSPELCLMAVKKNGPTLNYVPNKLRTPELCLIAVKQRPGSIEYVPEQHITTQLLQLAAKDLEAFAWRIPRKFITVDLCIFAVKNNISSWRYVPRDLHQQVLNGLPEALQKKIQAGDV